jgi:hypothetical protein
MTYFEEKNYLSMLNVCAGARAALRYGSSYQNHVAPAPQPFTRQFFFLQSFLDSQVDNTFVTFL